MLARANDPRIKVRVTAAAGQGFIDQPRRHPPPVAAQRLGEAHPRDVEYLRVTMRGLRAKLEADPARPALLINEPGIGYRLEGG